MPRFGLNAAIYTELARSTVAIVHNGAWVNHALPYSVLKKANVGGTLEVIRLAAEIRRFRGTPSVVHYVSSVSALPVGKVSA